ALSAGIESAKFLADNATNDGGATTTRFEIGGGGDLVLNGAWTVAAAEELPEGLVAWWKLDETSGTTANDSAGTNDGTLNGPVWVDTGVRRAADFDGTDDIITVPFSSDFDITTMSTWSVVMWVYFDDLNNGGLLGISPITINKGTQLLFTQDTDNIKVYTPGGNINFGEGGTTILTGQWYHLVFTYSSVSGMLIYIDTDSVSTANHTIASDTSNLYMGANYSGYADTFLNAKMAGVRIYDRVLPLSEIEELYASGE
ncbi:MAG: LamG domain-containing protein, partial [Candidatus Pacebacteria bacterium]|nr:LamG domain-containing protein [Candidatus Paceibacterota bacterium]